MGLSNYKHTPILYKSCKDRNFNLTDRKQYSRRSRPSLQESLFRINEAQKLANSSGCDKIANKRHFPPINEKTKHIKRLKTTINSNEDTKGLHRLNPNLCTPAKEESKLLKTTSKRKMMMGLECYSSPKKQIAVIPILENEEKNNFKTFKMLPNSIEESPIEEPLEEYFESLVISNNEVTKDVTYKPEYQNESQKMPVVSANSKISSYSVQSSSHNYFFISHKDYSQ